VTVNDLQGPEGIFGSVQVTSSLGSLLVPGNGIPVCVVNNDPVNSIYIGDTPSISAGQQTTTLLGPLNTCTFDGSVPVYGICSQGITVQALLFPTGSDWNPSPIQIQEQLADLGLATLVEQINQNTAIPTEMLHSNIGVTTEIAALLATGLPGGNPGGVPLLNLYDSLADASGSVITTGNAITLGPFTVSEIAYEFVLQLATLQNTAIAPVNVGFIWTDSTSGLETANQQYSMYAAYTGGSGPAHLIEGHGPSNADTLTVTITNSGTASVTVSYGLLQSSRPYMRHEWRTQPAGAFTTITFPTMTFISCDPATNILAGQVSSSLNNSSITYLLPFYVGTAQFWGGIAVDTNAGVFEIIDTLRTLSSTLLTRMKVGTTSFGNIGDVAPTPISLPRDQCQLQMSNLTATASTMTAGMIAQELETS
jgi:hypothetical protein